MVWMRSSLTPQMKCLEPRTSPVAMGETWLRFCPTERLPKDYLKPNLPTVWWVFWTLKFGWSAIFGWPGTQLSSAAQVHEYRGISSARTHGVLQNPRCEKDTQDRSMGPWNKAVVNGALKKNVEDHQWISRSLKMIPWFACYMQYISISICVSNLT